MGSDDLPGIEVVGVWEGRSSEGRVVSSPRRDRTVWVVAIGLVLVVAGGVLVSTDDDPAGDDDAAPSSTTTETTVPSTTVAPAGGAPGEYLADRPAPVFGEEVAATILLGSDGGGWRHLDPDTGWIQAVPELEGVDIAAVAPVPGGVVVLERPFETPSVLSLPVPVPRGADAVEVVELRVEPPSTDELEQVVGVLPNGPRGDRIWVLTMPVRPGEPEELLATLVEQRGRPVHDPFPIAAAPTAANDAGLVIDAGGRSYLTGVLGTVDLGPGQAYAAGGGHVGRIACDPALACRQEIVDVTAQVVASAPFPNRAASSEAVTMALGPDGSLATLPTRIPGPGLSPVDGAPSTTLHVLRPDGRSMQIAVNNPLSPPAWLPDDDGIVLLTGLGLLHLREVGGGLLAGRIPRLSPADATTVIVVPEL